MKNQHGAALVEFAIIALLFFMLLFGIIEFARAFFTYNILVEATRRGARVAAVCPADTAGIRQVQQTTFFDATHTQSTGMFGLSTANIAVTYFDSNMIPIASDTVSGASNSPVTSPITAPDAKDANGFYLYDKISFVQVSLQNINNIDLIIPGISLSIPVPPITTTLPSESLGRSSSDNPATRSCNFP